MSYNSLFLPGSARRPFQRVEGPLSFPVSLDVRSLSPPHQAFTTWLLAGLLLVLPIGQHAVAGVLICIGADGHVDIEDGREGDCGDRFDLGDRLHGLPAVALSSSQDDTCGDCVDVPILVNPSEARVALTESAPSPALVLPPAPLVIAPLALLDAVSFAELGPTLPPDLVALRTIVLLV